MSDAKTIQGRLDEEADAILRATIKNTGERFITDIGLHPSQNITIAGHSGNKKVSLQRQVRTLVALIEEEAFKVKQGPARQERTDAYMQRIEKAMTFLESQSSDDD